MSNCFVIFVAIFFYAPTVIKQAPGRWECTGQYFLPVIGASGGFDTGASI